MAAWYQDPDALAGEPDDAIAGVVAPVRARGTPDQGSQEKRSFPLCDREDWCEPKRSDE